MRERERAREHREGFGVYWVWGDSRFIGFKEHCKTCGCGNEHLSSLVLACMVCIVDPYLRIHFSEQPLALAIAPDLQPTSSPLHTKIGLAKAPDRHYL